MAVLLKQGGLGSGGINFDAKLRRESTSPEDLFYAHIVGMDALARGLRNAARMIEEGKVEGLVKDRWGGRLLAVCMLCAC
jgi:xylose isomerase